MKITSVNNDLIKETARLLQKKYREETGFFLIEGEKCIREAIDSGVQVTQIFSIEGFEDFDKRIEVTEAVLSKISDAKSAPKCVAVAKQLNYKWSDKYKKIILLEGIKDAGNLGTILRTAAAFGVDAIILYGDTVDLYNPKTVRSAVGNLWKTPVFKMSDLDKFEGYEKVATLPLGKNVINLKDYKMPQKVIVMFGSEADGLSEYLKNKADINVTIEMTNSVESLNLSISAGIVMYELMN